MVQEGEVVEVELLKSDKKTVSFEPLLIIEDKKVVVGNPIVEGASVSASIAAQDVKQNKVTSIRYKAKKRVHKVRGHRQRLTTLKIGSIQLDKRAGLPT